MNGMKLKWMKKRMSLSSNKSALGVLGDNHHHQENEDEAEPEELEDCLLCLEPLNSSDNKIPMLCPLDGCPFNYCAQCAWNLLQTSSQPYQEASDGSKQMKVPLQCPQCRTRYPHRQIVQDVLLLRQAFRLEPLFLTNATASSSSSTMRASDLSAKQDFLDQVTLQALQDSWARVDKYLKNRSHPHEGFEVDTITATSSRIPPLPMEWKDHLLQLDDDNETNNGHAKHKSSSSLGGGQAMYDLVDPTLFQGMEETMTLSEQEFLSKLLVSGSASNLMIAAQILHGMVQLMMQGGVKARQNNNNNHSLNISELATNTPLSATNNNNNNNYHRQFRMLALGTNLLYPDMELATLRKRFPLPRHMPRLVILPVYHPDRRGVPLQVKNHPRGLEITSVKGSAGQQGLRKGDVITHMNEEPCCDSSSSSSSCSSGEFANYMRTLYEAQQQQDKTTTTTKNQATVSLVVNAHEETAMELQKRSFEIIHFLTQQRNANKATNNKT
jgi:hypothetical protein